MLDKTKPYGEVCGGPLPYLYEQNNKFFNAAGHEVDSTGKVIEEIHDIPVLAKKKS